MFKIKIEYTFLILKEPKVQIINNLNNETDIMKKIILINNFFN